MIKRPERLPGMLSVHAAVCFTSCVPAAAAVLPSWGGRGDFTVVEAQQEPDPPLLNGPSRGSPHYSRQVR